MAVGVITGASSGIGAAVVRRMAADGHDLVLVAAAADAEELEAAAAEARRHGGRAVTLAADVADPGTAGSAIELAEELGGLDWLASNAGIAHYEDDVLELSLERFDQTFAVNVRGTFLFLREAARAMARRGEGAIAVTASTMATVAEEGFVSYTASKGAVAQLAQAFALDLAPYGIRVNAVAPGWVYTRATAAEIDDPERWSQGRSRVPMDRAGDPAEIAAAIAFLLSAEASYVTGTTLVADGGLTAGARYSDWRAVVDTSGPRQPRTRTGG